LRPVASAVAGSETAGVQACRRRRVAVAAAGGASAALTCGQVTAFRPRRAVPTHRPVIEVCRRD